MNKRCRWSCHSVVGGAPCRWLPVQIGPIYLHLRSGACAAVQDEYQNSPSVAEQAAILLPALPPAPPSRGCWVSSARRFHQNAIRYRQSSNGVGHSSVQCRRYLHRIETKGHGSPQAPARPRREQLRGLDDWHCVVVDRQVGEALRPDFLHAASDSRLKCPPKRRPLTDGAPPSSSSVSSCSGCSIRRHCNSPGAFQSRCFRPPKGLGQMFASLE